MRTQTRTSNDECSCFCALLCSLPQRLCVWSRYARMAMNLTLSPVFYHRAHVCGRFHSALIDTARALGIYGVGINMQSIIKRLCVWRGAHKKPRVYILEPPAAQVIVYYNRCGVAVTTDIVVVVISRCSGLNVWRPSSSSSSFVMLVVVFSSCSSVLVSSRRSDEHTPTKTRTL